MFHTPRAIRESTRCFVTLAACIALGGCGSSSRFVTSGPSGKRVSHTDARSLTANGDAALEQHGDEKPKLLRLVADNKYTPDVGFILVPDDAVGGEGSDAFRSTMSHVIHIGNVGGTQSRAKLLQVSQGELRKVANDKSTDPALLIAARANLAVVALALGDIEGFREALTLLNRNLSAIAAMTPDDHNAVAAVVNRINSLPDPVFPEAGKRIGESKRTENVTVEDGFMVVEATPARPAGPPEFAWEKGTPQKWHFPSIDIRCEFEGDLDALSKLGFTISNNTERVVELTKMAVRVVHNGERYEFQSINAGNRVLPGNSVTVLLQPAEGKNNFNYALGTESRGTSTFTVFDVPTVFDEMGNKTKMDNVTWKFKYKPGTHGIPAMPGGRVAKTKTVSVPVSEWHEFRRGVDLLTEADKR